MDVTNNSKALQGIHTLDGVTYIKPGETLSVRLSETLAGHAKGLDFLDVEGEPEPDNLGQADQKPVTNDETDSLKAQIADLTKKLAAKDAEIAKLKAKTDEPAKTPAEVLAMATNADVQFMTFKAAAQKLLGDKTPAKKDEIVAALEELATKP